MIVYDGSSSVYIYAPETEMQQLYGLCGYYSGNAEDDYATVVGTLRTQTDFINE